MKIALCLGLLIASAVNAGAAQCTKIIAVGGNRMPVDGSCGDSASTGAININITNVNNNQNWNSRQKRKDTFKFFKDEENFARSQRNAARKQKVEHDKKCRGLGLSAGCNLDNPGHTKLDDDREREEREQRNADYTARREADKAREDERRAREDARRQADDDRREAEREARTAKVSKK